MSLPDLGDMKQRVRRKAGDYSDTTITDPIIESEIAVGAELVWDYIIDDSNGRECLRRSSDSVSLVADQEEYSLPPQCMRLRAVEFRQRPDDQRWAMLTRRAPPGGTLARRGNDVLFSADTNTMHGLYWYDDAPAGYIRVWPALKSVSGQQIRFVYYQRPRMPENDGATFNDPDGTGAVLNLPDRVADAIEWAAVMELITDNLGVQLPYKVAEKNLYAALRAVVAVAYVTQPVRRYIPIVDPR